VIKKYFGSKKGLLRFCYYNMMYFCLGRYKQFTIIPVNISRVVFVCKGNICRSPLAHVVFQLNSGLPVASFGLDTTTGCAPHPPIVLHSKLQNFDLAEHLTTAVADFEFHENDLYVCTEMNHVEALKKLTNTDRIILLGLFGAPKRVYIHDPYNTGAEYTSMIVSYIIAATKSLVQRVKH
jgi:protein-tyrosine phosphatase